MAPDPGRASHYDDALLVGHGLPLSTGHKYAGRADLPEAHFFPCTVARAAGQLLKACRTVRHFALPPGRVVKFHQTATDFLAHPGTVGPRLKYAQKPTLSSHKRQGAQKAIVSPAKTMLNINEIFWECSAAPNMPRSARRNASRFSDHTRTVAQPRAANEAVSESLGPQLRLAREQRAVTVRELARRIGVSPSLVSQVERGLATPSVGTLLAIANDLGLEIGDLFKFGVRTGQTTPGPVQRGNSRKAIRLGSGVRWERLTAAADPEVEFLYAVYDVGSASCDEDSMLRHGGKEYGYLLSGRLGVKIGFEEYELCAGDSISFDAQTPHRLWCIGARPAVAIWAVVRRNGDERQPPAETAAGV